MKLGLDHWQPEVNNPRGQFSFGGGITGIPGYSSVGGFDDYGAFLLGQMSSFGKSVQFEVMTTNGERAKGLMFRRSLPAKSGMLFVYDRPQAATMWMKNTYIPLDMVFIASDGTIKHVHANAVPLSTDAVPSQFPVRAVLEINGGSARLLGIKPGDKVKHPIFGNV